MFMPLFIITLPNIRFFFLKIQLNNLFASRIVSYRIISMASMHLYIETLILGLQYAITLRMALFFMKPIYMIIIFYAIQFEQYNVQKL